MIRERMRISRWSHRVVPSAIYGPYRRANARLSGFAHDARLIQATEVSVKIFRNVRNVVGIAGMLLGGYIFVRSIPDVVRYIRISTM